jgi:eukaryotic-like serine/threonine-protein kinase
MATVFLARLSGVGGFQRFVAIKRLHPHLAHEHEFIQMFLDEARLAARLHHPHVVPILEVGESEDGYYLVMEYIEGDTLARLMARSAQAAKPLPPQVAVRVALDTLAGLHAAHELLDDEGKPLEIVHRDVSPQNILIGVDGSARITDFGVARAASRLTTTRSGQLKGKLSYMAPEQARAKPCDRRADIFAMGIVLWETLAKKRLFKGESEADTLNRLLYEPIPSLQSANPSVHPELEAVAMKALEREPDARFSTCSEMADALEKAARTADVSGVHRDVSTHLDAVIGTDISQQRDAVRAWLARSEPSKSGDPRFDGVASGSQWSKRVPKPSELASATRIEAGRASKEPKQPGDSNVSSVSSSVIGVPDAASSEVSQTSETRAGSVVSQRPEPPPRRSRAVWVIAALATLLLVGGAAFVKLRPPAGGGYGDRTASPPGSASAQAAPPRAATDVPAATATVDRAGAASSPSPAVEEATPSVEVTRPASSHARPATRPSTAPATKPSASAPPIASTPAVPDDITRNPYR